MRLQPQTACETTAIDLLPMQAVGGMRRGPGRPTAAAAAASAQQQAAAVVPVDRRVPVFSLSCLAKLLDAIADDGFQLPEVRAETGCWVWICHLSGSLHCWD